ncbi:MAG: hypothetical protein EOP87_15235 [Verrucomicrobiaceae bacterium]|nr:MAG: hypothetical protein EOP87_15235 [Verrucomicrobiaceae bacterium]
MQRYLPLVLIVGLLIAFRILGGLLLPSEFLPNFQPLAALFFCGALLAPGWRGFAIPAAIWAVTYPFATGFEHDALAFIATLSTTLLAFVAIFFMGKALSSRGFALMLVGSLASAVVFHVLTNGAAWLGNPVYEKTLTGLLGSLWTGHPSYPLPSWVFFRNFAVANVLFTAIFVGAQFRLPRLTMASPQPTALAE